MPSITIIVPFLMVKFSKKTTPSQSSYAPQRLKLPVAREENDLGQADLQRGLGDHHLRKRPT